MPEYARAHERVAAVMHARPFDELVRLAMTPRKERVARCARMVGPQPEVNEGRLQGRGRLHQRIMQVIERYGPQTGRQIAVRLAHPYDSVSATVSAMVRDELLTVAGVGLGPTGITCRRYGLFDG